MHTDLAEHFEEYFRFRVADSQALKNCCYQIRHQVYAEELGWEPVCENGMETDMADKHSVHCLLEHVPSGVFAGTIRLVLKPLEGTGFLPLEEHCRDYFDECGQRSSDYLNGQVAEISRLAVPAYFRRRIADRSRAFTAEKFDVEKVPFSEEERRKFPNIALGLYIGAVAVSCQIGISGVYALMEPRLQKRLQMLGLKFRQESKALDFRGLRAVYSISVEQVISSLRPVIRDIYNIIEKQITSQMVKPCDPSLPLLPVFRQKDVAQLSV